MLALSSVAFLQPASAQKRLDAPRTSTATVIVSPDDGFVQKWNTPKAPQIARLHAIEVDQKVTVGILLSGLRAVN